MIRCVETGEPRQEWSWNVVQSMEESSIHPDAHKEAGIEGYRTDTCAYKCAEDIRTGIVDTSIQEEDEQI